MTKKIPGYGVTGNIKPPLRCRYIRDVVDTRVMYTPRTGHTELVWPRTVDPKTTLRKQRTFVK